MLIVIPVIKAIAWLLLSRMQGNKPHRGTLQNLPNPASGTYTNTHRNSRELSNPPAQNQHTPEVTATFRNLPSLPPEYTPAYTGTVRNLPLEPKQFKTQLSGSFRNLLPEPIPAYTGTLRNLPEPSSGTCSCDPHRHTPELIWAEDPSSLRCWGINYLFMFDY